MEWRSPIGRAPLFYENPDGLRRIRTAGNGLQEIEWFLKHSYPAVKGRRASFGIADICIESSD
jgi:hypothetical protein